MYLVGARVAEAQDAGVVLARPLGIVGVITTVLSRDDPTSLMYKGAKNSFHADETCYLT